MPIHPCACDACGHTYDALTLSVLADPDTTCPRCHAAGRRHGFGVPAVKTEQFLPGTTFDGGQFAEADIRKKYAGAADTAGKRYMSSIARFPGDPRAWVSDLAEARRVIQANGMACPQLGVKGPDVAEVRPPTLAPDLVHGVIADMAANGDIPQTITKTAYRDLADGVREKHGMPADKAKRFASMKPRNKPPRARAVK